ncbi:MAG: phospholipase D-like domain-containing protein [Planctomycetaceae bacterium]|jgi:hypothetical protein|nr:phospholipase D-like domain-containing protein [Planctomycetaceae bacterium]
MTKVITNPFRADFMALCAESQTSIKLCAPYVKADVISEIYNRKQSGVSVQLITKVDIKSLYSGALDAESIGQVLAGGGKVFNCSNLHAKVYIFDDNKCIVSSANLTTSGLMQNAEFGVLTNDNNIVNSALDFYSTTINSKSVRRISKRNVAEIINLLAKIQPVQQIQYPQLSLTPSLNGNTLAISNGLSGWKREIFLLLGQFGDTFSSVDVNAMAQQLSEKHPVYEDRKAKIRQILQQLRDLGLVEFTSRGVYKKLWV